MLTALCLDLMGTLITDPFREALQAGTGLKMSELLPWKDPDAWPAFEIAQIDEAEFVRRFWTDPEPARAFDLEAFHTARLAGYGFLPGMEALLHDVDGHLERYVASNYPVWIEALADEFALHEHTEGVYASHHLGVRKPDPRFYTRLLERIGHEPACCLFVDDRSANCAGAEHAGMRAHLFDGVVGLRRRLVAEGVVLA